jgi:hypothetical protein
MRKEDYIAPVVDNIAVELENGIALSAAPAGYGSGGAAGDTIDETGTTTW